MTVSGPRLSATVLAQLLPMHLWLNNKGDVLSVGPTLAKVLPDLAGGLDEQVTGAHTGQGPDAFAAICAAVDRNRRLFLRSVQSPDLVLRGHGVRLDDGTILINLGFGIGLHQAIFQAGLTDDDFAPSDLAMELLFLHEANRGVLTELSRFNDQLARSRETALLQAQTDPLTGLSNRRGLELALAKALRPVSDTTEVEKAPFTLVHLDLDHFKQVNDRLGHKAGDDLLRAVGAVLQDHVRRADTAARVGGDEFVLILDGMTSQKALEQLSVRIINAIEKLSPPEMGEPGVSASLGIVIWSETSPQCPDEVLALADEALYASKRNGRGCATIR